MLTWVAVKHTASLDASDLGLAPGVWPLTLEVDGPDGSKVTLIKGNFARRRMTKDPNDFLWVNYYAEGDVAFSLRVYND
jgi:hypothetical protein